MKRFLAHCRTKRRTRILLLWAFSCINLTVCASCDPVASLKTMPSADLRAPGLVSHDMDPNGTLSLEFDEPVTVRAGSLGIASAKDTWIEAENLEKEQSTLISIQAALRSRPGEAHALRLSVEDAAGNTTHIVLPYYAPNPNPARLRLNEVLTKSSAKNSDAVEFLVTESGNIGGITVFLGSPKDYDSMFIFPALEVLKGDFLVLHCKPESLPEERDEISGIDVSGGKNASPFARDFWLKGSNGLPDSSGVITLAINPGGKIFDALLYSDKVSEAGKDYRSFGTRKLLARAEYIFKVGAWKGKSSAIIVEDAASSLGITATRSLCRGDSDSDSKSDWYVCAAGHLSLGASNDGEVYSPEPTKRAKK